MAVLSSERSRAPRGSKSISQAFFEALDAIPEARRAEVAKAAQSAIRDELKSRIVKAKALRVANGSRKSAIPASKPVKVASVRTTRASKSRATTRRSSGTTVSA